MTNKMDAVDFCRLLLGKDPQITPEEMCHNMHTSNYSIDDCARSLHIFFKSVTADAVIQILLKEFSHPLAGKDVLQRAMLAAGYPETEVVQALTKHYPMDTNRYALNLNPSLPKPYAAANAGYNFGTNDFTVEAWVNTSVPGTIISRKGGDGGYGNGGFLLVLKPEGHIKLATDDGFGFYEINTVPTRVLDGNWHHILGTRQNSELSIYVDFDKVTATSRTNRWAGLNINNSLRLLLGGSDQWQEDYNAFSGMIGEVRIWSCSVTYKDQLDWEETDWVSTHLTGCWSFFGKSPYDFAPYRNPISVDPNIKYSPWSIPAGNTYPTGLEDSI
ncbi:MAG: LamG domain-containing protein [Tissierellaceae bacterium]